jgi:hypothetical protein
VRRLAFLALALGGCAPPPTVAQAPVDFDPALCRMTASGAPRHLTIEELRICTRFDPSTGLLGLVTRGPMFHPAAWGQAADIAPRPARAGGF